MIAAILAKRRLQIAKSSLELTKLQLKAIELLPADEQEAARFKLLLEVQRRRYERR
jgi:hypothetical protein